MFAALTDFISYKIPNQIVIAIFIVGCMNLVFLENWNAVILFSAALLGGMLLGFVLFQLKYIGGGDAKLLAVCSAWMINVDLIGFLLLVSFAGGVIAIIYKFFGAPIQKFRGCVQEKIKGMLPEQMRDYLSIEPELQEALVHNQIIPYGVPIFIGAFVRIMM